MKGGVRIFFHGGRGGGRGGVRGVGVVVEVCMCGWVGA